MQSVFLKALTRKLDEAGLLAKHCPNGEGAPQPAWADDVAVLAPLGHADAVVPAIRRIVQVAEEESRAGGVRLNFEAGKTEALAVFRGPGSRAVKRHHLVATCPVVDVPLASGHTASVRLVDSYSHLGHLVNFAGGCIHDIRRHAAAANVVFRRLKPPFFATVSSPSGHALCLYALWFILSWGTGPAYGCHKARARGPPFNMLL